MVTASIGFGMARNNDADFETVLDNFATEWTMTGMVYEVKFDTRKDRQDACKVVRDDETIDLRSRRPKSIVVRRRYKVEYDTEEI